MWVLWVVVSLVVIFIVFRLWVGTVGNWRATLNSVITTYIANEQLHPDYNKKELFMSVLDGRYPYSEKGLKGKLYQAKEEAKLKAEKEIESGLSVMDTYNLTNLIFTCLVIEGNSILQKNRYNSVEEFLDVISTEVNRQGHSQLNF